MHKECFVQEEKKDEDHRVLENPRRLPCSFTTTNNSSQLYSVYQTIYTLWVKYSHVSNLLNLNGKQHRANMLFHGGI